MSTLGKKILAGLADAREFATSSTTGRRVHRVAVPERIDVKAIRARLKL